MQSTAAERWGSLRTRAATARLSEAGSGSTKSVLSSRGLCEKHASEAEDEYTARMEMAGRSPRRRGRKKAPRPRPNDAPPEVPSSVAMLLMRTYKLYVKSSRAADMANVERKRA